MEKNTVIKEEKLNVVKIELCVLELNILKEVKFIFQ